MSTIASYSFHRLPEANSPRRQGARFGNNPSGSHGNEILTIWGPIKSGIKLGGDLSTYVCYIEQGLEMVRTCYKSYGRLKFKTNYNKGLSVFLVFKTNSILASRTLIL
jgi:hypothetical protein